MWKTALFLALISAETVKGQEKAVYKVLPNPSKSCYHEGRWYADGSRVPSSGPCEHCQCNQGQVACFIQDCARPQCSNPTVPPGQCCPVCNGPDTGKSCYHEGRWYADGSSVPSSGPCEHCQCYQGQVSCFIQDCAAPQCSNPTVPPGQCCPVCNGPDTGKSCYHEGRWYADGSRVPSSSPCEHCRCSQGQVACVIQDCARPQCSNPTVPPGQCCPVCNGPDTGKSCYHEGRWYADGSSVPSSSPCEHCRCYQGQVSCFIQDCAAPQCSNPTVPPGQCCPVCNGPDTELA